MQQVGGNGDISHRGHALGRVTLHVCEPEELTEHHGGRPLSIALRPGKERRHRGSVERGDTDICSGHGEIVVGSRHAENRSLARDRPDIVVALREGTSAALTRALRAGNLDIALLAGVPPHRPPDDREPTLEVEILAEGPLRIAVGASHRLAGRARVHAEELIGERWVAARSEGQEQLLGAWPGSGGRPNAPYVVRDWLTKLQLVASGTAIATIPDVLVPALPPEVQHLSVDGGDPERRRLLLVRMPGPTQPETEAVTLALRAAAVAPRAAPPASQGRRMS